MDGNNIGLYSPIIINVNKSYEEMNQFQPEAFHLISDLQNLSPVLTWNLLLLEKYFLNNKMMG